jgi:hypothetical protein
VPGVLNVSEPGATLVVIELLAALFALLPAAFVAKTTNV